MLERLKGNTMIHRKFIALITATSIAVTGLTIAPAHAGKNDTAKIIAGVAALALIGVAISESKKRKRKRNRAARDQPYDDGGFYGDHNGRDDNIYNDGGFRRDDDFYDDGRFNRPLPRRVQRKVLPRSCKVQARTRRGRVPAYSGNCLHRNFRYANALPHRCAFKARTRRGGSRHRVYGRDCLANHGYRPGNY